MEWDACVDFLTKVSAYDRRTVTKEDVTAWSEFFSRNAWITVPLALEAAARHFESSTEWLKPAHIRDQAKAAKASLDRDAAKREALTAAPAPSRVGGSWRERNPEAWAQAYEQGFVKGAEDRARSQARFEHLDERVAAEHGRSWALAQLAVPVGKRARVMPWPPPGAPLSAEHPQDAPVWG